MTVREYHAGSGSVKAAHRSEFQTLDAIDSLQLYAERCGVESNCEMFEESGHSQQPRYGQDIRESSAHRYDSSRQVKRDIVEIEWGFPLNAIRRYEFSLFYFETDRAPDTRMKNALRCTRINNRVKSFRARCVLCGQCDIHGNCGGVEKPTTCLRGGRGTSGMESLGSHSNGAPGLWRLN